MPPATTTNPMTTAVPLTHLPAVRPLYAAQLVVRRPQEVSGPGRTAPCAAAPRRESLVLVRLALALAGDLRRDPRLGAGLGAARLRHIRQRPGRRIRGLGLAEQRLVAAFGLEVGIAGSLSRRRR